MVDSPRGHRVEEVHLFCSNCAATLLVRLAHAELLFGADSLRSTMPLYQEFRQRIDDGVLVDEKTSSRGSASR